MSKIQNPTVLIIKRENSDTYAVAITNASDNFHDAELMASMEPDMHGDAIDTWSKTGYYMAEEIQKLRQRIEELESKNLKYINLVDTYDWQRQRLHSAAQKVISWCKQEAEDRTGNADAAENYSCVRELRAALEFCEKCEGGNTMPVNGVTTGKPLTVTLPDSSSKAFWSGAGKSEVFHPKTYQSWVKEAIEQACVIAGIGVEVK